MICHDNCSSLWGRLAFASMQSGVPTKVEGLASHYLHDRCTTGEKPKAEGAARVQCCVIGFEAEKGKHCDGCIVEPASVGYVCVLNTQAGGVIPPLGSVVVWQAGGVIPPLGT